MRNKTYTQQFQEQVDRVKRAFATMSLRAPMAAKSFTVVLEAAFWLVQTGIVNVRGESSVNVKQARSLFHLAAWIQKKKTAEWLNDASSGLKASSQKVMKWHKERGLDMFRQVLCGAAGTGKTTLVLVMEHLHDHFFSSSECGADGTAWKESSFAKTAPTNTAARINGGDTCHAFYKLPLRNLAGKRGKLSANVLRSFRQRLKHIVGQVIDEMSMLTPQENDHIDFRCKEGQPAGYNAAYDYGGIGTTLAGDFLQMPPVRRAGLAKDINLAERAEAEQDEDVEKMIGVDVWSTSEVLRCGDVSIRP